MFLTVSVLSVLRRLSGLIPIKQIRKSASFPEEGACLDAAGLLAGGQLLCRAGYCVAVAALFLNEAKAACTTPARASRAREAFGSLLSTGEITPGNSLGLPLCSARMQGCWG